MCIIKKHINMWCGVLTGPHHLNLMKNGQTFVCMHCKEEKIFDGTCHRNRDGIICGDCFLEHYDICVVCNSVFPLSESDDGETCKYCQGRII